MTKLEREEGTVVVRVRDGDGREGVHGTAVA